MAVIVKDCPKQIAYIPPMTVGVWKTDTVLTAVLLLTQPAVLVPTTEYEVVSSGETMGPDESVNVEAPDGISVNDFPEQMVPLLIETVGVMGTHMSNVC